MSLALYVALLVTAPFPKAPEAEQPAPPDRMRCFRSAYPDVICGSDDNALVLCDGTKLVWDDGRGDKGYEVMLETPDLEETARLRYLPGRDFPVPDVNFDPGRVRYQPLFEALYGRTRLEIETRLEKVPWMPHRGGTSVLKVHKAIADRVRAISDELEKELTPELAEIARETAGAFTWRTIRGSKRVSMHAFGIAIDIGVKRSDYWDWKKPDASGRYRWKNRFPWEIARVFERHGFIWGAKWYHFDTMHFEYRPELLAEPCVGR